MPTARARLSAEEVDSKIYAIGGWNGSALTTVEEYDPFGDIESIPVYMFIKD